MSTSITQKDVENLEQALVSGELMVRIGDRWITYRSIDEIKEALDYAKGQIKMSSSTTRRATAYVANVDRGLG
jgi:RNA-binding protein YhbY